MRIYNTKTRRKEEFKPINEGKVGIYVCGPTVYDFIHIGNARPMIVFDTLRRYFEHKGYEVNYVTNFTDVDDKIIKRSIEENIPASEVSEKYIAECKKDMEALNVRPATVHPQRKILLILFFGSQRRKVSLHGCLHGVKVVQAGILSVHVCLKSM